jgi:hypothetical protein
LTGDDEDDEDVAPDVGIKDAGFVMDDDVACLLIVPTSGGAGTIKRILFSTNFLFPRIVFLPF